MNQIGQIIAKHRKKKNLSQPKLAELLKECGYDLTNKAISKWEKGNSEPSVSIFMQLCRILEIEDVYEDYFGSNPFNALSSLNNIGRLKALDYIELLNNSPKYQSHYSTYKTQRKIRLYDNRISAGTGNFLSSDAYEEIEVGEEVPDTASYGLRITGNSMEPQFINGQIVWVKQQSYLDNGEIGIFYLNGDAYIKKLQDDEHGLFLISLNKQYSSIHIKDNDSFKIFGKVVG